MTDTTCPTCGKTLLRVTQPSSSPLNSYQFEAMKAGDWYCVHCPSNDRGNTPYCYWWEREVKHAIGGQSRPIPG